MRITTTIIVFFILLNGFAVALSASGVTDEWGTQPTPGDAEGLTTAQNEADNISPSGGGLSTLFGLIVSVGSSIGTIFAGILPAVAMLGDLGVPSYIIGWVSAPLTLLAAIELADYLRGVG